MKQARHSPEYLHNGIIYQIFLRTCTPQGTLEAARKLLPNIASLGTTIVYLCPIFEADDDMDPRYWSIRQRGAGTNNPKNPYRMKDFYAIDPEYGTEEDLHAFVRDAHALGMRVWLDMVFFHCGPNAVHIQEHPDWVKRDENGDFTLGVWAFPVHDFAKPELREYLLDNMVHWVRDFDVDGFRCDVGTLMPLDFWEEGRRRLEAIKPDVTMLCEGERPEDQLYAFDLDYAFSWYKHNFPAVMSGEAPASALKDAWDKANAKWPAGARHMRAIDTHGTSDSSTVKGARYEKAWTHAGMDAVLCLNYWIDGVPFLYNGMEVADDAPHCVWADRFHAKNTVVDWSYAVTKEGRARTALLRRLAKMRKEHPALLKGETRWVEAGESLLVFERVCAEEKLLCAVNLGRNAVPFEAPENAEKIFARAGKHTLPPFGAALYRIS
ncbi:MAG: DUF3459 domain-containing protein [Clostridia bacterium]|nr:DUF3459 domain-containing protein [Clostridia bacterium]